MGGTRGGPSPQISDPPRVVFHPAQGKGSPQQNRIKESGGPPVGAFLPDQGCIENEGVKSGTPSRLGLRQHARSALFSIPEPTCRTPGAGVCKWVVFAMENPAPKPDPLYVALEEAIDTALALWDDPVFAAVWQGGFGPAILTGDDLPDMLGVPRKILTDTKRMRLAELAVAAAAEIKTGIRGLVPDAGTYDPQTHH